MDGRISNLEKEILLIKERNSRVEEDKAWETSWLRRLVLGLMTYFVMLLVMLSIGIDQPFLNAIVPTLGFVLSTLSLSFIKKFWLKRKKTI